MPAAGELQADRLSELVSAVRHAMSSLRYRWLDVHIGGPTATMRGQWRVVTVAALVIFGCFFAIGRLTATSGGGQVSATATEASSSHPAIPAGLSGGSPPAGAVPSAIVARPRPSSRATNAAVKATPAPTPTVVSLAAQPVDAQAQSAPRSAPVRSTAPAGGSEPTSGTEQVSPSTGGSGRNAATSSPKPASTHSTSSPKSPENQSFDSSE